MGTPVLRKHKGLFNAITSVISRHNPEMATYLNNEEDLNALIFNLSETRTHIELTLQPNPDKKKFTGSVTATITKISLYDFLEGIGFPMELKEEEVDEAFQLLRQQLGNSIVLGPVNEYGYPTIVYTGLETPIPKTITLESKTNNDILYLVQEGGFGLRIIKVPKGFSQQPTLEEVLEYASLRSPMGDILTLSTDNDNTRVEITEDATVKTINGSKADHITDRLYLPENTIRFRFKLTRKSIWLLFNGNKDEAACVRVGDSGNQGQLNRVRYSRNNFLVYGSVGRLQGQTTTYFPKHGNIVEVIHFYENEIETVIVRMGSEGSDNWDECFRFTSNELGKFYRDQFSLKPIGLMAGVSNTELQGLPTNEHGIIASGVMYRNITEDDYAPPPVFIPEPVDELPPQDKYLILLTAGQSNMVGYDESVINLDDYPIDERLMQWGIYDEDRNRLIPLGPHAHAYQDMRPYSNPNNTVPNLGTKGMHYPVAKAILDNLLPRLKAEGSESYDGYKILIINGAFGATTFEQADGEAGLDETGFLPKSMTMGSRWGENSSYYLSLLRRLEHVLTNYPGSKLIGMLWMQGEHGTTNNLPGYTRLREHFGNYVSNLPEDKLINTQYNAEHYPGERRAAKEHLIFIEANDYWKEKSDYRQYLEQVRRLHHDTTDIELVSYVETHGAPDNSVNGTGKTTSTRRAHYGNDAYVTHVTPAVIEELYKLMSNKLDKPENLPM